LWGAEHGHAVIHDLTSISESGPLRVFLEEIAKSTVHSKTFNVDVKREGGMKYTALNFTIAAENIYLLLVKGKANPQVWNMAGLTPMHAWLSHVNGWQAELHAMQSLPEEGRPTTMIFNRISANIDAVFKACETLLTYSPTTTTTTNTEAEIGAITPVSVAANCLSSTMETPLFMAGNNKKHINYNSYYYTCDYYDNDIICGVWGVGCLCTATTLTHLPSKFFYLLLDHGANMGEGRMKPRHH